MNPISRCSSPLKKRRKCADAAEETKKNYKPRQKRVRTTHSLKFKTVKEEVQQRLFAPPKNKLDLLVRTFYARFGGQWVPWEEVKKIGSEVKYSKTGNVFKDTWVLRCSRYGRNSDTVGCSEPFGLNFPYWNVEVRVVDGKRQTYVQLSPEFFVHNIATV